VVLDHCSPAAALVAFIIAERHLEEAMLLEKLKDNATTETIKTWRGGRRRNDGDEGTGGSGEYSWEYSKNISADALIYYSVS
jgi:hypothetical protein